MLRLQYSEAPKAATTKVKLSKEGIRRRLDDDVKMAKKVFGRSFAVCVEKDLNPLSSLKPQMVPP